MLPTGYHPQDKTYPQDINVMDTPNGYKMLPTGYNLYPVGPLVDHQFYPVGNVLYPVDKILFILWVTLKLYPVGDILWATLKLYPVGNMSVTYRIYRMLSTGLKMFPTGYHPQDIILSCG